MNVRAIAFALAAGVAVCIVVSVAIAGLLVPTTEISTLVGLVGGVSIGTVVTIGVLLGMSEHSYGRQRSVAFGVGTFGVVLLAALVVGLGVARTGLALSLLTSTPVGLLAGVTAFFWHRKGPANVTSGDPVPGE